MIDVDLRVLWLSRLACAFLGGRSWLPLRPRDCIGVPLSSGVHLLSTAPEVWPVSVLPDGNVDSCAKNGQQE